MVHVAKLSPTTAAACLDCNTKDVTPPPMPEVRVAAASAKLYGPDAQFSSHTPAAPAPAPRDPAYIELGDWEPGTRIQILNKTNTPTSSFDCAKDVVTLEPTGRDIDNRIASVWLTQADMDKIDLDAGDSIWIRTIDAAGNASQPAKTRLQGAGYGERGNVLDAGAWHPASRMRLLDGEADWKSNMVMRHIADQKAPQVKAFEAKLTLKTSETGVTLDGSGLLEEGARVAIRNGTNGALFQGTVDGEQGLRMDLGNNVSNGDTLFVTVSDLNGVAAGKFELRYGSNCKDGRSTPKGILGARLAGVIKPS